MEVNTCTGYNTYSYAMQFSLGLENKLGLIKSINVMTNQFMKTRLFSDLESFLAAAKSHATCI